jgi:hypothetical protein
MAGTRTSPTTKSREHRKNNEASREASNAPEQIVENSRVGKQALQSSDQPGTRQRFLSSSAKTLRQTIAVKQAEFSGFGVRGSGLAAVLVAGGVVVVWLAFKYLR